MTQCLCFPPGPPSPSRPLHPPSSIWVPHLHPDPLYSCSRCRTAAEPPECCNSPQILPLLPPPPSALQPRSGSGPPRGQGGTVGGMLARGVPTLQHFSTTETGSAESGNGGSRIIISPKLGLESGIKSPAPPSTCENTTAQHPAAPPRIRDGPDCPGLGAQHRSGGERGTPRDGEEQQAGQGGADAGP